jgi:hypothetical protein
LKALSLQEQPPTTSIRCSAVSLIKAWGITNTQDHAMHAIYLLLKCTMLIPMQQLEGSSTALYTSVDIRVYIFCTDNITHLHLSVFIYAEINWIESVFTV